MQRQWQTTHARLVLRQRSINRTKLADKMVFEFKTADLPGAWLHVQVTGRLSWAIQALIGLFTSSLNSVSSVLNIVDNFN